MKGRRELIAGAVGGIVESFDWTIYAILAPFFASQMFAGEDGLTKLLSAYAGFAVGFVVRPLGSYLLGRIADARGRRFSLVISMATICLGSLLIAVLPTAATIGVAAPVLLVLLRALQGIAMGGENPSVAAYITETAPENRRFLYSSLSYTGAFIGNIVCFVVVGALMAVMGEQGVTDGGWRIGFVVAAVFGVLAFWVRSSAAESEEFESEKQVEEPRPKVREHLRNMLSVFLMTTGTTVGVYYGTVYLPEYAAQVGVEHSVATNLEMVPALLALIAAMAVSGLLADRFGGMRVFRVGALALAVGTVPLMTALAQGWLPMWAVATCYLVLGVAPTTAVANVMYSEVFPVAVRVVAMGVPFTLAIALFGGTFPLLAEGLAALGSLTAVPWVAAGTAVITLLGTWVFKRG
ncbi:MFS transporter [Saccharopolyspora sp. NPDC002686]|uniref:MFS transporter n=1 Tax=Saccharopolyspora sp. NPDC002686 TaxID=3154541 RepID=UPI00332ACFA3